MPVLIEPKVNHEREIKQPVIDIVTTYSYDEAFEKSLKYFNGNDLAAKVFLDKYALRNNNDELLEATPDQMHRRLAREFARIEKDKFKKPLTEDEIFSHLDEFKRIIPQGSILYGAGNQFQTISLSNCFVLDSPLDSYGGIHRTDEQLSQISKRRGGTGLDLSALRPSGAATKNAAKTSTGIIPFMERFSNSIREVGQSGRRGALMQTLSVHHPEILEFVKVKRDLTRVTGANISVRLTDEFLNAVQKDEEYEQRWTVDAEQPKISKMVKARDVWMQIVENAHAMAEPGLIFWDNIIRESPADCYASEGFRTTCTNPCSELPLSPLDSCRLLLLNLFAYVEHPFKKTAKFDFDAFAEDVMVAERLMDDVIDLEIEKIDDIIKKVTSDPESADIKRIELNLWKGVKKACEQGRRTGLGITALGDTLAALGIDYGSDKGLRTAEKIYQSLKINAYRSSVDMAKEIGHFPVWDHEKEKDCPFLVRIKDQDEDLWNDMKKHGRRNISLLTTAPAGTVSILAKAINRFGTSSGIEPQFTVHPYTRRKKINPSDENAKTDFVDQSGDHWQEFEVYPSAVLDWIDESGEKDIKKSPWFGCCAEELDWKQRVKLQAAAQKHIDHSISSTLNLPEDVTVDQVAEIYETAWKAGTKGITVYRKDCRTGVLVEKKAERNGSIVKTTAPKRPKALDSELYFTTVKGDHYFVIVGSLKNGTEPYEVFVGNNGFVSKRGTLKGKTLRESRGRYHGMFEGDIELRNISSFCSDEEESLTRMISTALRHGADASFIVHQLEKAKGDLQSPSKAIARVLKKWIADGTRVTGSDCPSCSSSELERSSGCVVCKSCGYSACH